MAPAGGVDSYVAGPILTLLVLPVLLLRGEPMVVNLRNRYTPHLVEPPPPRDPRPAALESRLAGKRVVLIEVDETTGRSRYTRDFRAASEVLVDPEDGRRVVHVIDEASWYGARSELTPESPNADFQRWPAELVWVE